MSTVTKTCTNGVSFGTRYVPTATDASDGAIVFAFEGVDYDLAASVVVTVADAVVALTGAAITYPTYGQVSVANGGSFTIATTQTFSVLAQRAN
jgi:hypothetical protein